MRISRKPSPKRLKDKTTIKMANPGTKVSQGASKMNLFPSERMLPQVALGGGTPKPRKLNPASVKIAPAMPMVAETRTGAIALGTM